MFKKIFSVLLIMTIVVSSASAFASESANTYKEDIFTYEVKDGGAIITNIEDAREIVIVPDSLGGYTVRELANGACGGSQKIKEITLCDSITSIGNMCFAYSTSITKINLPKHLLTIGDHAFLQCEGIWSVTIPSETVSIGENAFDKCSSLVAATVPESVIYIGNNSFPIDTGLCIYGKVGSAADEYAYDNWIAFEELIHVTVNGEPVIFDQPCITDTKVYRTLVPMRAVMEALGANIEFDYVVEYATITIADNTVLLKADSPFMMVNGNAVFLSSPAIEYNNRLLLPIRDVVEAVGGKVDWNEETKVVSITY